MLAFKKRGENWRTKCSQVCQISGQRTDEDIALGAKVIAAAGSRDKIDVAVRHGGADYGVDYTQPNWQQEVLKLTGGKGVNVIYDPVGMIKGPCAPWTVYGSFPVLRLLLQTA